MDAAKESSSMRLRRIVLSRFWLRSCCGFFARMRRAAVRRPPQRITTRAEGSGGASASAALSGTSGGRNNLRDQACDSNQRQDTRLHRHRGDLGSEEDDKPWASMFYVAYTRDDVRDPTERPITFAFNGGPGSSSVWLHLGALGPKRVEMGPEASSRSRRITSSTTTTRRWSSPIWSSSIRSPPVSAARRPEKTRAVPRLRRRSGVGGRIYPAVPDPRRALGVAEISGWRELRHHARGRALAIACRRVSI